MAGITVTRVVRVSHRLVMTDDENAHTLAGRIAETLQRELQSGQEVQSVSIDFEPGECFALQDETRATAQTKRKAKIGDILS